MRQQTEENADKLQNETPETNLKTHGVQSYERPTCSGRNAQTNFYFATV